MSAPASFRLAEGLSAEAVATRLAEVYATAPAAAVVERRTFHDSFDWRIWRNGGIYETTGKGASRLHLWRSEDRVRHRLSHAGDPAFSAALPAGPFRKDLAAVLKMRRLLPLADVVQKVCPLAVLDAEAKTTVRIRIVSGTVAAPGGRQRQQLAPRVRVLPVRGYERDHERVARFLAEDCGLIPDSAGELEHALRPLGRVPGDYSSKVRVELDPAMRAADAARAIHQSLLATMLRNVDGLAQDLDSEFLHDFRVSIRRTRSVLSQVRDVFPPEALEHFKEEFRWLLGETGKNRDFDVYLLKLDSYRADLPDEVRGDLAPLEEYLARMQRVEHQRVVKALRSRRYRRLVEEWRTFLAEPGEDETEPTNAARPARVVASERIWQVYRKMLKRGRKIGADTPPAALHDMRIRGKKLRYLLECFRGLYPPEAVDHLVAQLKRLQDNLGDFNDYQVQREDLELFAEDMAREGPAPVRMVLAMGRLLDRLGAGQAAERKQFEKRFARFASAENRASFESLFMARQGR